LVVGAMSIYQKNSAVNKLAPKNRELYDITMNMKQGLRDGVSVRPSAQFFTRATAPTPFDETLFPLAQEAKLRQEQISVNPRIPKYPHSLMGNTYVA